MLAGDGFRVQAKWCTCTYKYTRHLVIAQPAEQNGNFIMIAAGVSGCNYQRRLIHTLIGSFNLFTFGAEQCQPAAVESDLLQGRGTYRRHKLSACVCMFVWRRKHVLNHGGMRPG